MIYFGTLVQAWSLVLFFLKTKPPPHGIITWLSVGAWRGILSTLEMDNFHFQSSVVLSTVLGLFLIELLLGRLEIVEILRNQLNAFSRCSNLLLHCSCILEISVLSFPPHFQLLWCVLVVCDMWVFSSWSSPTWERRKKKRIIRPDSKTIISICLIKLHLN